MELNAKPTNPPEPVSREELQARAYKTLRDVVRLLVIGFERPWSEVQAHFQSILSEEASYAKNSRTE